MRYVCIHGHFYQPPRENPWIESIERQQSAHPFHDWNERINAECYSPNAASRILDEEKQVVRIVNNYSKISFNFGPTLFSWIEQNDPDVYKAILDADAESRRNHSGHGSALAQAYHHMILPLANEADKYTQVLWGIRDFEYRFGREPEGLWLPESAVDIPTLEVLAQLGIKFTILAPNQASRVRKLGERKWTNVGNSQIDPSSATLLRLPSGRSISLFFYDGPLSRAVAFEGLLGNGERFARRLLGTFPDGSDECPPLIHIATDGETYGHHHRYGEMALSYALNYIETNQLAELTNYGEYLERHPPSRVVEIFENSSWSCAHGVERWRSNCGCNSGGHGDWNQNWRGPLREALNWLRDTLKPIFEDNAKSLLHKPWEARNDYIDVILDRSADNFERFVAKHSVRPLKESEKATVWKLMELQRHAMMMYTSCGWFFDELSGIETVQVMQYAGRAVQLAEELGGEKIEARFVELLSKAKSNIAEHRDGALIFAKFVKPAFADARKVSVPYTIWRGRALGDGDLAARARRSSRLAIRIPVQISSREASGIHDVCTAWTVVVNKNGARFECGRGFQLNEEVKISDHATGRKATGRIIWATPTPDEEGNFEFAVGLDKPTNLWQVNSPPHDWEACSTSSESESLLPPWEEASDSAAHLIPEQRIVERTTAGPPAASAPMASAAPAEETAFAVSNPPAAPGGGASLPKSPIGFHSSDSPAGAFAAAALVPAGAEPVAAPVLASPVADIAAKAVRPEPLRPLDMASGGYTSQPTGQPQKWDSLRKDSRAATDRLTALVQDMVESTLQARLEIAAEQSVLSLEERYRMSQESALAELGVQASALVNSQRAALAERAHEIDERSRAIADQELQRIANAGEEETGRVREDAGKARAAVLDNLRDSVASEIPGLRMQVVEQCSLQVEAQVQAQVEAQIQAQVQAEVQAMMSELVDRARREIASRIEEIGRRVERMAERAEEALIQSAGQLEQASAKALADSTSRMEQRMEEAAKSVLSDVAERILRETGGREDRLLEQAQLEIGATSQKSLAETRIRLARSLREAAKSIEISPQE